MLRDNEVNKLQSLWAGFRYGGLLLVIMLAVISSRAMAQDSDQRSEKSLDVKSSYGDMHIGSDADIRETGLPAYPGARVRKHDDQHGSADLALFTSAFGFKLVVVNFDSEDAPGKVIGFYREKLKKYGKVLECHTRKQGGDVDVEEHGDESHSSKALTCDGDNTGPIVELKSGTEDNQHAVAIEPAERGNGSTFSVVYVHARGRQGEI